MDGLDLALADEALHEQRRMHDVMACCCGEFDDPELPDHGCVLAAEVVRLRVERDRLADGIREHSCGISKGCYCTWDEDGNPIGGKHSPNCWQPFESERRLKALLDVAGDDREDGR